MCVQRGDEGQEIILLKVLVSLVLHFAKGQSKGSSSSGNRVRDRGNDVLETDGRKETVIVAREAIIVEALS